MRITFLGTAGYIDVWSPLHGMQSSTLASFRGTTVMLDCGQDWLDRVNDIRPDAIFITHAHPDHFWGVRHGAPCPVWATAESWSTASWRGQIDQARVIRPREPVRVGGLTVEAFTCRHSTRAPAVGYRLTAGRRCIFYVPDVLSIDTPVEALVGVDAYIGDGAAIDRSIVHPTKAGEPVGHAAIRTQLGWLESAGVHRAWFTHCGSQITRSDERVVEPRIRNMGRERGVVALVAHDGDHVVL